MTLYETLKAAGVEIDHHESDLYFPVTPETTAILDGYPEHRKNACTFVPSDGSKPVRWFDVPFAFDPFWQGKAAKPIGCEETAHYRCEA